MNDFFNSLSPKPTIIHRMDIRIKIICAVGFIMISSSLQTVTGLGVLAFTLIMIHGFVGTKFSVVIRRVSWIFLFGGVLIIIFPFITTGHEVFTLQIYHWSLQATEEGLIKALILFFRLITAVLVLTLLNATTSFKEILEGFRRLGVPSLLVGLLELTVRYFFVLQDELYRMKLARKARAYELNSSIFHKKALSTMSQMVAVLFIRSMERSERVYFSMLARGYQSKQERSGNVPIQFADILWGTGFIGISITIKLLETGGYIG